MKPKNYTARALIATLTLSTSFIGGAGAAVIKFDYMSASGTTLSPTTVSFGVGVTDLTLNNTANTSNAFGNHFYHNNWSPTIDLGKYYETTITNTDDGRINLGCMSFSMENTSGTSNWFLRSSDDSFSNNIASGSFSGGLVTDFVNVDTSGLAPLTSGNSVTLRWYVTSETSNIRAGFANHHPGAAGGGLSDVGIDLSIQTNCVPEPSSAALLGLGGLALILRRQR